MSFNIEILETVYNLEVETAISDNIATLDIEVSTNNIVEINADYVANVVFASDVVGLDSYMADFIDNYEIDCGSP